MKPASLNENIVYLCSRFAHSFTQLLQTELHRNGLRITPEQLSIMVMLWYNGSSTQQALSQGLHRDKTTIARVVRNMTRTRLISEAAHPKDNRSKLISLTKKGKRIQEAAVQVSGELYMKALQNIKEDELLTGIGVVQQLLNNINL